MKNVEYTLAVVNTAVKSGENIPKEIAKDLMDMWGIKTEDGRFHVQKGSLHTGGVGYAFITLEAAVLWALKNKGGV